MVIAGTDAGVAGAVVMWFLRPVVQTKNENKQDQIALRHRAQDLTL
jgi:hypothetical protein